MLPIACSNDLKCVTSAGVCVECVEDGNCPYKSACVNYQCIPDPFCSNDNDCVYPQPYCEIIASQCVQCMTDIHCSTDQFCGYEGNCLYGPREKPVNWIKVVIILGLAILFILLVYYIRYKLFS